LSDIDPKDKNKDKRGDNRGPLKKMKKKKKSGLEWHRETRRPNGVGSKGERDLGGGALFSEVQRCGGAYRK